MLFLRFNLKTKYKLGAIENNTWRKKRNDLLDGISESKRLLYL